MPIDGKWEADNEILKLCGIWDCPENTYCGSPDDYNLPKIEGENDYEAFVWDFGRFDDFFHSFLVVLTFLNVTGWSGTTFMVFFLIYFIVLESYDNICYSNIFFGTNSIISFYFI